MEEATWIKSKEYDRETLRNDKKYMKNEWKTRVIIGYVDCVMLYILIIIYFISIYYVISYYILLYYIT